jgi:hypothetical protein
MRDGNHGWTEDRPGDPSYAIYGFADIRFAFYLGLALGVLGFSTLSLVVGAIFP